MPPLFACHLRLVVPLAAWVIDLGELGLGQPGPAT